MRKILLLTIFIFSVHASTEGQQHWRSRKVAISDSFCWARSESLWAVPCGFAFHLSGVTDETPPIYGFAPSYEQAKDEIRKIFDKDKQRGLVRKCQ